VVVVGYPDAVDPFAFDLVPGTDSIPEKVAEPSHRMLQMQKRKRFST